MKAKRAFDIAVSATALIALSPVFAVVSGAACWRFRRAPFYSTPRTGKDGRPFQIMKFRTMADEKDDAGALLDEPARTPAFGRFLRVTGIDELPQLWNILKGDMSLVGPRPRAPGEVAGNADAMGLYERVLAVRPGLTGPWQVATIGKGPMTDMERMRLDYAYAACDPSLARDLALMARSLPAFVRGHNGELPAASSGGLSWPLIR